MFAMQLAGHPGDRWPYTTFMEAIVLNNLELYTKPKLKAMGRDFSRVHKKQLLMANQALRKTHLTLELMTVIMSTGPRMDLDASSTSI